MTRVLTVCVNCVFLVHLVIIVDNGTCLWRTQKARPSLMAQPSAESPNRCMLVWAEEVNTNDRWSALITNFKIWLQTWVNDSTCNHVVSPKSRHLPSKTSWSRKLETKISHCWTTLTSNSSLTWSPTWRFTYVLLQSLHFYFQKIYMCMCVWCVAWILQINLFSTWGEWS